MRKKFSKNKAQGNCWKKSERIYVENCIPFESNRKKKTDLKKWIFFITTTTETAKKTHKNSIV